MNDIDLDRALRAKYAARASGAPSHSLARRVLAIPATIPSRRGRLPRLSFGGITPMFSPTRLIAGAAVIALSGGVLVS